MGPFKIHPGCYAACVGVLMLAPLHASAQSFREDFNGSELDSTVWTIDAGNGEVVVARGVVALFCAGGAFPVVTTRNDPFPPGEFRVRVGMRYVMQSFCGDGIGAMDNFWENYHGGVACRPFLLWQDTGGLYVYSGSAGPTPLSPPPDLGYHVYEWLYTNGQYVFSMDGTIRAVGGCAPRATRIFFGHPHPIGCSPWTSFEIDFIEIAPSGATPALTPSWGQLKQVYR